MWADHHVPLKKYAIRSGEHKCWWLCFLWLTDGSLGEFTPGNWGEWQTCQLGTQTRQRLCQNFPPVYSGLNSSYQLYDTKKCGKWLLGGEGAVERNRGVEKTTIEDLLNTFPSLEFLIETCPTGWSLFNKYCYKPINYTLEKNWVDARETCLNINSDLVSIKSEEENKFVAAAFSIGKSAWIGLRYGTGVWTDGSNVTYFATIQRTSVNLTQRDCYALNNKFKWFIINCLTGLKQVVCKRIGLYKVLHLKVTSSLDQFMPPSCITMILSCPSLDSVLGRGLFKSRLTLTQDYLLTEVLIFCV